MTQIYETVLTPAHGGFEEWDRVQAWSVDGGETLADYEEMLSDPGGADLAGKWERTDELSGRIHKEYGQVYRINSGDLDPAGSPIYTYAMAWVEEVQEEGQTE